MFVRNIKNRLERYIELQTQRWIYEHAWFGLFDEAGMVKSLKGVSGSGRVKAGALGTQSEWWHMLITSGRQTQMLLRWNPIEG